MAEEVQEQETAEETINQQIVAESEKRALDRLTASYVYEYTLTANQRKAAQMLADGNRTLREIAQECVVSERELIYGWMKLPGFPELIQQFAKINEAIAFQTGLGRRLYRIQCLNDRHERLMRVIRCREMDAYEQGAPEIAKTGIVVKRGEDYRVDRDLLAELREIEKQAQGEMEQFANVVQNTEEHVTRIKIRPVVAKPPEGVKSLVHENV